MRRFSTLVAQQLARRYQADSSAADWRRFGRLPGLTNRKPKHRWANGRFPFVLLRSCSGRPFTRAESFGLEVTSRYQQEQNRRTLERRIEQQKRFPHTGRSTRSRQWNGFGRYPDTAIVLQQQIWPSASRHSPSKCRKTLSCAHWKTTICPVIQILLGGLRTSSAHFQRSIAGSLTSRGRSRD
jgi:hypothetical protein